MRILLTLLMMSILISPLWSQSLENKYLVTFKDKVGMEFDPFDYFDAKTIERRLLLGIPLKQFSDYPVNPTYVKGVKEHAEVKTITRWFNGVVCFASNESIMEIALKSFVKDIEKLISTTVNVSSADSGQMNHTDIALLKAQTKRFNPNSFKERSVDGSGVRIAIFDVGFINYKTNSTLQHIVKSGRVVKTWNFAKNKEDVENGGSHGLTVMSCIAGKTKNHDIGLATGAEFLLARTENRTEFYSEEENWLAAAEWADKNGADIINSSLGYTFHRYFPEEMDGKTALVSRAANMAARKGILVVNSAGNEGTDKWHVIGAPADADSVLSIGGLNPFTGYHTSFSSFGPTSDGRMKPNVTAFGHVYATEKWDDLSNTQGTSFSSPLVAGFAACVMQFRPGLKGMKLFEALEASGDLYPYYDYAHGYGVPQADYFVKDEELDVNKIPTLNIAQTSSGWKINILDTTELNISRISEIAIQEPGMLYVKLSNHKGEIIHFKVLNVNKPRHWYEEPNDAWIYHFGDYPNVSKISAFYRGYFLSNLKK